MEVFDELCDAPSEELAGPGPSDVLVLVDELEPCLARCLVAFPRFPAPRKPAAARFMMVDIDSPSVSLLALGTESQYDRAGV